MKKIYTFPVLSFLILIPCFSACQTEVPIDEMAEAHKAIRIAKALKAGKYAPELFKRAEDNLYNSHTACKDNKIEDVKKFAAAAKSAAEEASKISWPSLAADTLKEAQDMYAEAESLTAEKTAPTQMNSAAEKIKRAESLNAESSHNLSYVESLSAMLDIEAAKSLLEKSIPSQITALRKEIAGIKNDANAAALLSDITSAENLLDSAENNLNNKNIKAALTQIDEAGKKITALKAALLEAKNNSLASNQSLQTDSKNTESVKTEPVKDKQTGSRIYTVKYIPKERDCLWRIAQKEYQDASLWPRIYMANRDKIKDPDLIFPGQRLIIPDIPDAVRKAKAKRTVRATQKNTPKNQAVIKNTENKDISKASGSDNKPPTSNNTDKGGISGGSGGISGDGGGTSGDSGGISGSSSEGEAAGREAFLPEGIFREKQ